MKKMICLAGGVLALGAGAAGLYVSPSGSNKNAGSVKAPFATITFSGTRGKNGEYLSIVEAPGTVLKNWAPAPEIVPGVWKTKLARRPDLVMMDGKMITCINSSTMALPRWKKLPGELNENMFWGKFGPGCKRLPGVDFLRLPKDIRVSHSYFGGRKEQLRPAIGMEEKGRI